MLSRMKEVLLLFVILILAVNIQPVLSSGTIYIRADGSIDPPSAPISSADNITYTFTGDILESLVVQRDNIVVDGAGYAIKGTGMGFGIRLHHTENVTVKNLVVRGFEKGIVIKDSFNTTLFRNTVADNEFGVSGLTYSGRITWNNIRNSTYFGLILVYSQHNTIINNNIMDNGVGLALLGSFNNTVYHNNFENNSVQACVIPNKYNSWDRGYPSGGNYWSDYSGDDVYRGKYQNETGSDGIGDIPYIVCGNNQDNYPLMESWKPANLTTTYPWLMFRRDLRHTGHAESPGPNSNRTFGIFTSDGDILSSPAIADNRVYIGSNDGNIYAVDQHTGTTIWNYTTGGPVRSSPAVDGNEIFVGSDDDRVYCLDAETGTHIWNYKTGDNVSSSPAVADGTVIVASEDGNLYAVDQYTGTTIWNYMIGGRVFSSPAVADGEVYIGSVIGEVYCLDVETGEQVWNQTLGGPVYSSPAVVSGDVYVGSRDGNFYCLDAETGTHIWNYKTDGLLSSSPAVVMDKVYVGSGDGRIYCLDAETGTHIWNYTTGGEVFSSPAVADGKVYIGSFDDRVYCLDAETGTHIWNYKTGDDVYSSPAVADGKVFVGSLDDRLYVFGKIIRVPEDFIIIQRAIDFAFPGDTIAVAPGVYHETLFVNKPLTIHGRRGSSSDFDGGGSGIAITIADTSDVTISNVVITNYEQGILIENSVDCEVYGNIFQDNGVAINLTDSSVSNTIYHNSFINNEVEVSATSISVWDNGYPDGGNYWYTHTGLDLCSSPSQDVPGSDGIIDTQYTIAGDNVDRYPLTKPFSQHDIGITEVIKPKTIIAEGQTLTLEIRIQNYGIYDETSTITAYAETTPVAAQMITVTARNPRVGYFEWDTSGFAKGNYTISAAATAITDEIYTADNVFTDDWIIIAMVGDVTGPDGWPDGKVDIRDIAAVAVLFGVVYPDPRYNANYDIIYDGKIDIRDIATTAKHFGEIDP